MGSSLLFMLRSCPERKRHGKWGGGQVDISKGKGAVQGWQFPTKKLFRVRRNRRNNWFVPAEIRSAEEKNARNSVPWSKNRSKLSEFRSEAFRGTENSRNSIPNCSTEKKNVGILFREKKNRSKLSEFRSKACLGLKHAVYSACWSRIFCKTNFFIFSSVPSLKIDSFVNLRMPQNKHFFRGITEAILSLFSGIFSERNFIANPRAVMVAVTPLNSVVREVVCGILLLELLE